MARTSRVAHPVGARYTQVYAWAVRAVGLPAAAVLGVVDFLDRGEDQPGRPVVSRARLVADLEGIVGRNSVDTALSRLVALGWLRRHERRVVGPTNLQTSYLYSLDAEQIALWLGGDDAELGDSPESLFGDSGNPDLGTPGIPKSEAPDSLNRDRGRVPERESSTNQYLSAAAETAAAASGGTQRQRRSRESGIVTYLPADIVLAATIEASWPRSWVAAVVRALCADGKEAVPGRVEAGLEQAAAEMGISAARDSKYAAQQTSRRDSSPAADSSSPSAIKALAEAKRIKQAQFGQRA